MGDLSGFLPGMGGMEPVKSDEEKRREETLNIRLTSLRAAENYYYSKGGEKPQSFRDVLYAAAAFEAFIRDGAV